MRWFRWNRRWGSYAALFALALQLALSFGHVHHDNLALSTKRPAQPETPSGTVPDRDDVCAICITISLSGSLLIPDAPALVFAAAHHEPFFSDLIAAFVSEPARSRFQARAPPI